MLLLTLYSIVSDVLTISVYECLGHFLTVNMLVLLLLSVLHLFAMRPHQRVPRRASFRIALEARVEIEHGAAKKVVFHYVYHFLLSFLVFS